MKNGTRDDTAIRRRPGGRRDSSLHGPVGRGGRKRSPGWLPASTSSSSAASLDRARQRTVAGDAVERIGVGPRGDAAALGLEADEPGPRRGDAHRTGAVRPDRARDEPGRDRRRRPRARPARRAAEVPRVAGHAEGDRVTGRPLPELRRRRLAHDHRTRQRGAAGRPRRRRAWAGARPPDPNGVVSPATSVSSLTATGTPSSGACSPRARRRSAASASARARSASTTRNAPSTGWAASIASERGVGQLPRADLAAAHGRGQRATPAPMARHGRGTVGRGAEASGPTIRHLPHDRSWGQVVDRSGLCWGRAAARWGSSGDLLGISRQALDHGGAQAQDACQPSGKRAERNGTGRQTAERSGVGRGRGERQRPSGQGRGEEKGVGAPPGATSRPGRRGDPRIRAPPRTDEDGPERHAAPAEGHSGPLRVRAQSFPATSSGRTSFDGMLLGAGAAGRDPPPLPWRRCAPA